MDQIKEATHTFATYSFAHYCESVAKEKRKKYLDENFSVNLKTREDAFGPHNGCEGDCEGTGWVPVSKDDMTQPYRGMWTKAEHEAPSEDGWHFVPCPTCQKDHDSHEHIVREGKKFVLRRNGQPICEFVITEDSKLPGDKGEDKVDRTAREHGDAKKKAENDREADSEKKQASKERRAEKQKERDQKKLMPYEFTSQKDAERASGHLGLHGSHTAGNGIYKPGSSENSLRDAVHRKKEKQKMHSGRFHEQVEADVLQLIKETVIR